MIKYEIAITVIYCCFCIIILQIVVMYMVLCTASHIIVCLVVLWNDPFMLSQTFAQQ